MTFLATRVGLVVPPKMRQCMLDELHESHPGIVNRMRWHYVWWPKMNTDIEEVVRVCDTCQSTRALPAVAPLHPWEWPQQPWSRLHADFAGPFQGQMFVLSGHTMKSITSLETIEELVAYDFRYPWFTP